MYKIYKNVTYKSKFRAFIAISAIIWETKIPSRAMAGKKILQQKYLKPPLCIMYIKQWSN